MRAGRIQTIIRIGIFCLFLLILAKMVDFRLAQEIIQRVRLEIVLLAILVYFVNIAVRAYRWQTILNKDGAHLTFKEAYLVTLIGIALNIFVPATLGDLARSYYGYKLYGMKEKMLSSTLVDKLVALGALFLIGAVSGYIVQEYVLGAFSVVASILILLPLTVPRAIPWQIANSIVRMFKKTLDPEKLQRAFTLSSELKLLVMAISIAGWLVTCFYFYVLCSAFPVKVSLGYITAIMPIITLVRLFPFTVNALGPPEVAIAYFFGLIGIHPTLAVLISLASNIVSSLIPGSLGFLILLTRGHGMRRKEGQNKS